MIAVFAQADFTVTRSQVSDWLKKDDDTEQEPVDDKILACFLNGLINDMRGKKDGAKPEPEDKLDYNIIFRKLKIALNLQAEDILKILALVDIKISKHELSAFFRKKGHKHYRVCQAQILRNFLHGIQIKYRGDKKTEKENVWGQSKN
ncbi:MAG: hypothetical protein ACI9GW_001927 [Halieaceae bacterium]|jgi:uncharacterized protein YehS (DUF1456 family)